MPLRVNGSTSGYTEIAAPAVAGNNTVVLPSANPTVSGTSIVGDTSGNLSYSTALSASSLNGGQLAGMRNRIINGAMAVDQRSAGASISTSGGTVYTLDRWYVGANGASATVQRVSGSLANTFRLQVTGAAGVTSAFVGQRIEAANSADLAGQVVTLSADLSNSLLTSVTWILSYANSTDSFGPISGTPTVTTIATGTFTVNSTSTRYSTQISIPAAATTGLVITFNVGAQTSGTFTIGNVQLEPGTVATPFERRSYGQELALCQRYYQNYTISGDYTDTLSATYIFRAYSFPVTMRAIPTIAVFSQFQYFSLASGVNFTPNIINSTVSSFYVGSTGLTNARGLVGGTVSATAEL